MAAGIYRGAIVPHTPRMGLPEIVPEFQKEIVASIADIGADIRADKPDVMIVCSTHYVSTFNWLASTVERHEGHCVAMEAPDMIAGEYYSYKGDPELGRAFMAEVIEAGYPCVENASTYYSWDYATWVPVHYMDPESEVPIVTVPVVLHADQEESYKAGQAMARACEKTGRRAVMVASSALAHKLARNPAAWPTEERQQADKKFIGMLLDGQLAEAWRWFPDYSREVVAEMGGRCLAFMLGGVSGFEGAKLETRQFGPYAQSSGSGNVNLSVKLAA